MSTFKGSSIIVMPHASLLCTMIYAMYRTFSVEQEMPFPNKVLPEKKKEGVQIQVRGNVTYHMSSNKN